jgi:DNA-binding transcriptional regulator YiaG/predicted RNA-binding Zn-ribbon protein involved in translation (DUF1610 family)
MARTKKKKKKKKLTEAQFRTLLLLEKKVQAKVNFTCGVGLSRLGLASYKSRGSFRITARGIRFLRNRRNSEKALRPRREGKRGIRRHNTWVSITPTMILESRERLMMSQQELANLIGVSRQTISNWEGRGNSPTASTASLEHQNRLCDIFSALNAHWESCSDSEIVAPRCEHCGSDQLKQRDKKSRRGRPIFDCESCGLRFVLRLRFS